MEGTCMDHIMFHLASHPSPISETGCELYRQEDFSRLEELDNPGSEITHYSTSILIVPPGLSTSHISPTRLKSCPSDSFAPL